MMIQPRKSKFRKQFRGKMRGNSKGFRMNFGEYGLKATNRSWLTPNQIEAARKAITNHTKRKAKVWIRVFPDKPITQKGAGAPLGAGKGDVCGHVCVVKPGKIIFEIAGVPEDISLEALKRASSKLPLTTKIVKK